ncbi:MAG TPA: alpha-amylase family glycosyl hydrolase [Kofleriaceae bacterium]|jgi:glycosidase|nr:alpha-amylase family glycosyl hydrolase [Kofleriaceae bacterium]
MKSLALAALAFFVACSPPHHAGGDDDGSPNDGGVTGDGGGSGITPTACTTTFRYAPPGSPPSQVSVSGDWNNWTDPGVPMMVDATGAWSATVPVTPGLVAYKFIVDGNWILDPDEKWQKYEGGVANSAVQVPNCQLPVLSAGAHAVNRPNAGAGEIAASVVFTPGAGAPAIDPTSASATIRKDNVTTAVTATVSGSMISVDATGLADGKYTIFVSAKDLAGQAPVEPLRLVFWVEASQFTWQDALIYMVMTDRFVDGDPSNNPPPMKDPNGNAVDPREDYQGGDFAGVTAKINAGVFDQLGVTVLWLSPFNTNPSDAWVASDNVHYVSGFHGYWPIKARAVDPRFGTADDLHALVTAAHAHGIRVIQDLVVQHAHQEHEYMAAHPDWFNTTGCICGTDNCDWTVHRLDCLFTSYLPNIDWTNTEGDAQWEADAIWWLDTFDLDGFRMDAVKQVPDIAVINLVSAVRGEFEASGTPVFMTGETAMGWNGDNLSDNLSQYQLISEYINPDGLNGQFDFVLYYAVPMNVFATTTKGMIHLDYWTMESQLQYPAGSIMSPYIGSQDTARFTTIATYDGNSSLDQTQPYNQWTNIAEAVPPSSVYGEQRLALTWLMTLPGAPMLYYGDEYGQTGGVDPNNRVMWTPPGSLTADQQTTLAWTQLVGQARKALPALRRGAYVSVYNTDENTLIFARQDAAGDVALVALTRNTTTTTVTASLPAALGIANTTVLHDHLGGPDVTVANGSITVTVQPQSAAILAP